MIIKKLRKLKSWTWKEFKSLKKSGDHEGAKHLKRVVDRISEMIQSEREEARKDCRKWSG